MKEISGVNSNSHWINSRIAYKPAQLAQQHSHDCMVATTVWMEVKEDIYHLTARIECCASCSFFIHLRILIAHTEPRSCLPNLSISQNHVTMPAETLPYQNGVVANSNSSTADSVAAKKSRESDRRRRRRKQKKNNKASEEPAPNTAEESDDAKENTDPKQVLILLTIITILSFDALVNFLLLLEVL